MIKNKWILAATFVLLTARLSPLFGLGFDAAVGGSRITPWGEAAYKGTSLDLKNDLNLAQATAVQGRLKAELPLFLPNLYLIAAPMKFEGKGSIGRPFQFAGRSFAANQEFSSSLKLDRYDLAVYYGIPILKTATAGIFNIDLGVNVRLIDFKAEISQAQSGISESKSLTFAVPMGYLSFQISPIDLIKIEAELRGIGYKSQRYFDAAGRVKLKVLPLLYIAGGYRFENMHLSQEDVNTDLRFGGPTAEIGVEF